MHSGTDGTTKFVEQQSRDQCAYGTGGKWVSHIKLPPPTPFFWQRRISPKNLHFLDSYSLLSVTFRMYLGLYIEGLWLSLESNQFSKLLEMHCSLFQGASRLTQVHIPYFNSALRFEGFLDSKESSSLLASMMLLIRNYKYNHNWLNTVLSYTTSS